MPSPRIIHWNPLSGEPLGLGAVVLSVGVFDGVHVGHRFLLQAAAQRARELGAQLATISFDADPDEFFVAPEARGGKLLSNEGRLQLLAQVTGGTVVSLPASRELYAMQPEAFLASMGAIGAPRAVYVGCDFRFGAHASGSVADIARWCEGHGCRCMPTPLLQRGGAPVTATRIRGLLGTGEVARARELLAGRAHSVHGQVVRGRGAGAGLGFATANLLLDEDGPMLPAEGVYGGYAHVDGQRYPAAVNVGVARSFSAATAPVEAHLLGFAGELYGKRVEVSFVQWLREPRVFSSQEELVQTVTANIEWVRENLGGGADGAH